MSSSAEQTIAHAKTHWWVRTVKIALWTVMALLLFCIGMIVGCVHLLSSDKLTTLVESAANHALNAEVSIGHIELSMRHSAPFLDIDIADLSIVATDMKRLPPHAHADIPQWADTLLSVDHIHGGINIAHLTVNRLTLSDVEITRPGINIAVAANNINNFNIFPTTTAEPAKKKSPLPRIEIKKFTIVDPRPCRYIDAESGTHATLNMHTITLTGVHAPVYTFDFDSNLETPLLAMLNLSQIPISFNGNLVWDQSNIYAFALRDFFFSIAVFSGKIDTSLDLNKNLVVNDFNLDINPFSVTDALALVPDTLLAGTGFNPADLTTDMRLGLAVKLNSPFEADAAHIPPMTISLQIPQCSARWRQVDLRKLALDMSIDIPGDNIDATIVDITRLAAAGPATDITLSGRLTSLLTDPEFDGRLDGHIDLRMLPPVVSRLAEGSLRGQLTAKTNIKGSRSMLSTRYFHLLRIDGDIDLDNFRYERYDTTTFVNLRHACLKFDSNKTTVKAGKRLDNLLSATIDVDTATIYHSDMAMNLSGFRIAVGALNDGTAASGDTTLVIPMGGGMKASTFNLTTLTDSTVLRVRHVKGNIVMKRFQNQARVPEFNAYLDIDRISTGDRTTRLLISQSTLRLTTHMVPHRKGLSDDARHKVNAIADSLRRYAIDIPDDSIPLMAMREYRRKTHSHVSTSLDASDNETIDWDTSRDLRRILLGWDFNGTLTAKRARLFSQYFPLRNRMSNLNIAFCNDSITFNNVSYKAGQSDFLVSGKISNIKKALTSRRNPSPLRIEFDLLSDSIDINQLAKATFDGAAYAATPRPGVVIADDDESHLETFIEDHTTHPNDSMAPILVPVNIEAEIHVKANNITYADILLHNLSGALLLYDGAVSMNNLRANSEIGSVNLSALYSAPNTNDMKFGFGLRVNAFNIANFLNLVPAVDSMMPIMRNFSGIINANIAATSDIDHHMNLVMPSLKANIDLKGDSLVVIDPDTYKTVAKWLLFKDKNRNMIDHMSVQLVVQDNKLEVFPFMFDFDRYRLGVQGSNDLDMNFKYHVSVLKSPIPFKFGINITGNPDKYKIRLGRARFNEREAISRENIVETSRINLINEIQGVFRRGVRRSHFADLPIDARPLATDIDLSTDTLTSADSLLFIREGLLPAPQPLPPPTPPPSKPKKTKRPRP